MCLLRSALPMAILAGHAPGAETNGSSSPVPDLRIDSPASPLQNVPRPFQNGYRDAKKVKNGSAATSPDENEPLREIGGRMVTFAVTANTANNDAAAEVRLVSSRPPKRNIVQRSVSAFVPSSNRTGNGSELGTRAGKFSAKLLRSHSAATTSVTPLMPSSSTSSADLPQSHLNSDLNLAPILFGVVIVFVCCNFPRVVINIYDFAVVDSIIDCDSRGVGRMPAPWIVCSISISNLCLLINSSVNFLVYCVAGTR